MRKFAVPFQEVNSDGELETRNWEILAHSKEDARQKTVEHFAENEYVKHISSTKYIIDLGLYIPEKDQYKGYHNPY